MIHFDDMPIVTPKKGVKTKRFDPGKKLRDPSFVAKAFFQALVENDVEGALDIVDYVLFDR